jgi:hypothetical protein
MNCFNHPDITAVAICKCCGRGVCSSCAGSGQEAITCSDCCEEEAARNVKLVSSASSAMNITATMMRSIAILFMVLAAITIGLPFLSYFNGTQLIFWPIGFVCFFCAWLFFKAAQQYSAIGNDS